MNSKFIRIANGQGFWGDSIQAPVDLIDRAKIDYLTLDYLAEVTMSIMQRQRAKNPKLGYATDFPLLIESIKSKLINEKIRVVTNAGGANPIECANKIKELCPDIKIAVVTGDDILSDISEYMDKGCEFLNLETGDKLDSILNSICSVNVYIDSFCISDALKKNPHIVLTGRTTDPGLVLGPCIHEFNWSKYDYTNLAMGTVAGHILECGAQSSGGNFSDWKNVPDFDDIGYPIAEIGKNNYFDITKDNSFGGLVNRFTVAEQLLYEMGDPKHYLSPDVTVDFTSIKLDEIEQNTVRVSNISGQKPTDTFKVCINYISGYKASGQLTVTGPNVLDKANKISDIVKARLKRYGCVYDDFHVDYIGYNSCDKVTDIQGFEPREIGVRISVMDKDKSKVSRFTKEIAPLITNGPPGITGFAGGRPKVQDVYNYWPSLIDKSMVSTSIKVI